MSAAPERSGAALFFAYMLMGMRRIAILFLSTSPLLASETVLLHTFKEASADTYSGGGAARMQRAIENLSEKGGAKSAAALTRFIKQTLEAEDKTRADRIAVEKRGWAAHIGSKRLKKELGHLRHRESAGATDLGPQIESRENQLAKFQEILATAMSDTTREVRRQESMIAQRERATVACTKILARLEPDLYALALSSIRSTLDIDHRDESLLLVRMLREANRKQSASPLLAIYSHPKALPAARAEAACAVAMLGDGRSTRELIERLRKDESIDRKRLVHLFSLAAKRKLADLDAAAEWAKTLK